MEEVEEPKKGSPGHSRTPWRQEDDKNSQKRRKEKKKGVKGRKKEASRRRWTVTLIKLGIQVEV